MNGAAFRTTPMRGLKGVRYVCCGISAFPKVCMMRQKKKKEKKKKEAEGKAAVARAWEESKRD